MTMQQPVWFAVRGWGRITDVHDGTRVARQFEEVVHSGTHSAAVMLM